MRRGLLVTYASAFVLVLAGTLLFFSTTSVLWLVPVLVGVVAVPVASRRDAAAARGPAVAVAALLGALVLVAGIAVFWAFKDPVALLISLLALLTLLYALGALQRPRKA